jgi:FtsZ-interacting cell division protein ZipA
MSYQWFLATFGLGQIELETILILAGITAVIGFAVVLFWQYILGGATVLAVLFVFAHHPKDTPTPVVTNVNSESAESVKQVQVKHEPTEEEMYLEDCTNLSSKPEECKEMWKERNE